MSISIVVIVVILILVFVMSKSNKSVNITQTSDEIGIKASVDSNVVMIVEDVFNITGRGIVFVGKVINDSLQVGDNVIIQNPKTMNNISSTVVGIEMFRKKVEIANIGDTVGVLLKDIKKDDIESGFYIIK